MEAHTRQARAPGGARGGTGPAPFLPADVPPARLARLLEDTRVHSHSFIRSVLHSINISGALVLVERVVNKALSAFVEVTLLNSKQSKLEP